MNNFDYLTQSLLISEREITVFDENEKKIQKIKGNVVEHIQELTVGVSFEFNSIDDDDPYYIWETLDSYRKCFIINKQDWSVVYNPEKLCLWAIGEYGINFTIDFYGDKDSFVALAYLFRPHEHEYILK